ncbi:PTS transporter subunit EIIC [Mollicutes bacterium LVI A0078]|nr:PTS transporter subunit EIIC [Mollicutes bacterium LVI A0075]WOO90209.1 PTS transporter subunit EIIC [Mollicutes bacterium LVI A0078]
MNKISDKINNWIMKISEPLIKFSELDSISAIQEALVACVPIIVIGSFFLIFGVLGSPSIGASGESTLKFLEPYSANFFGMNDLLMNFLALYVGVALALTYSKKKGIDPISGVLLGISFFFVFNIGAVEDGMISVANFSATGLFSTMVTTIVALNIYQFLVNKNITIRLPKEVPPNVGAAFTSLVPYLLVLTIAWIIRSLLDIDIVALSTTFLTPYLDAADNIFSYTFREFMTNLLWAVGLHGDNMFAAPIFSPFETMWLADNAQAVQNGVAGTDLPHIMTYNGIDRMTNWTATVWPLIFLMIRSDIKHLKALGWACLPSAMFTIVEPVIFGLPLALNPFLLLPYLLISVVTAIISYLSFSLELINRFYISLPWATPPFILGPVGTGGDFRTIILIIILFVIGLVIYTPFFRKYEEHLRSKQVKVEE